MQNPNTKASLLRADCEETLAQGTPAKPMKLLEQQCANEIRSFVI
jgi:hypothetical protein